MRIPIRRGRSFDARDPATLAAVLSVVAGAAACATYLPARRAAGVDPSEILKAE
jgi:ABC-type lipoprotein release transport system permease subunit